MEIISSRYQEVSFYISIRSYFLDLFFKLRRKILLVIRINLLWVVYSLGISTNEMTDIVDMMKSVFVNYCNATHCMFMSILV